MDNFATEMLKELKTNTKRWFIISIVELVIILSISGMFIYYINQPLETITYTQEADSQDNSVINQKIGE